MNRADHFSKQGRTPGATLRPRLAAVCIGATIAVAASLTTNLKSTVALPDDGLPDLSQSAPATWPGDGDWVPFKCGAVTATDPLGDGSSSDSSDLVGESSTPYPAAYYYPTDHYLYIRMRLDDDAVSTAPGNAPLEQFGWGIGIDTDGDYGTIEFNYILDGIGEEMRATEGMDNNAPDIATAWDNTGWYRTGAVPDGSTFNTDPDFYVDFAMPIDDFITWTATANPTHPFAAQRASVWVATSVNGQSLNKDVLCWNDDDAVDWPSSIVDPIPIGKFLDPVAPPDGATLISGTPTITGSASGTVKVRYVTG